ncbi:MAG: NAD(P)H-hydrate dehydratase [Candidatus Scalindua sediminis]|nr:NAD(P)H-hydrate dehydratase [Candidatus Scalindua sediminis]HDY67015.1 NAD(P)H-hydrate dehydratase [Candidatus Scalindua sp.]
MLRVKNLPKLISRKKNTHKGSYGRVLVLAGSPGMTGAAYLCCKAALRSGSGLVTLGIPKSLNFVMETKLTCVMTHPLPETKALTLSNKGREEILKLCEKHDVVALGPGLSQQPETKKLILWMIKTINRSIVIDADGINTLTGNLHILCKIKKNVVLTPHPGEMSRLINLGLAKDVQKKRIDIATKFVKSIHKQLGKERDFILVLKGDKTIVANYNKVYINHTGNPGMATAGAGDVLTGIIVSLIGQGFNVFDASQLGVYIHGLAGDIASKKKGEVSMIASDILDCLPDAFIRYGKERL